MTGEILRVTDDFHFITNHPVDKISKLLKFVRRQYVDPVAPCPLPGRFSESRCIR